MVVTTEDFRGDDAPRTTADETTTESKTRAGRGSLADAPEPVG